MSRNIEKRVYTLNTKAAGFQLVNSRPKPLQSGQIGPLFTFTSQLRNTMPALEDPATETIAETHARNSSSTITEPELHNDPINKSKSGKMMSDWVNLSAQLYLDSIIATKAHTVSSQRCDACSLATADLTSCCDCSHARVLCAVCLVNTHVALPGHRFRQKAGNHLEDVPSWQTGLVLYLGHSGRPCDLGTEQMFTLGDTTGIHQVKVRFCRHIGHASPAVQLLDARIYPCSETRPSSGFTFGCLRLFHLLAAEAKLSAEQFWNVLCYQTSAIAPDLVPDRYREFLRVTRQWQFLQSVKRAGKKTVKPDPSGDPDLALRCPACPIQNVNFLASSVTKDNCFQLYRKDKAYDSWDQCLTDGRMYFAQSAQYNEFLSNVNTDGTNATSRHSACNNHKAADNNWVKFTGVAETGVGSAICARHSCFLPLATVNFNTPERFYYADFCFVSAITRSLSEGVTSVGIHYDILCHYIVKMWERWARMKHPLRSLTPQDFLEFIASVPKFHLAGHVDICFVLYCLNHIFGVGRLDAEGGEPCWANLNHAAASTCERGPGSRVDTLNYVMHQWNWSKTV
ncbi:hypothetical protein FRC12_018357 [Ceratobasidium sp. 428]|nr:hypothetical protein FRC12_018357 [Ceratobasidium sp. 428]